VKRTICPYCGKTMIDDNDSIRFRCQYCKQFFDEKEWEPELHERIIEAIPKRNGESDLNV